MSNRVSRGSDPLSHDDTAVCLTCGQQDDLQAIPSQNETICTGCIDTIVVPNLNNALIFEGSYPVPYGIKMADSPGLFSDDFVHRFLQREREYNTVDRIWCPYRMVSATAPELGSSAGKGVSLDSASLEAAISIGEQVEECHAVVCERHDRPKTVICHRCCGSLCGRCGTAGIQKHECKYEKIYAATIESKLRQQVGKDVQFCPNQRCKKGWNLLSGCNHIVCNGCGTNFCFLCGEEAVANSGHWSRAANHPRFHQPDDSNAVFDEDLPTNDAEENVAFEDEEDDEILLWEPGEAVRNLIMVEQYRSIDGATWFETFISLGRILEEIEEAMGLNPDFLPILQEHLPSMPIVIAFQGDLDESDVSRAWIIEVDAGHPIDETAREPIRTALAALDSYWAADDHTMLANLVSNALFHQGHRTFPAQRGQATQDTEQTGIRQLPAIPAALEDPFAAIRALQRQVRPDLSELENDGDMADEER